MHNGKVCIKLVRAKGVVELQSLARTRRLSYSRYYSFLFLHNLCNKLHCITMKLYSALRFLTTAPRTPAISSESTFMRLAKPFIGHTQLMSQILPFSTAASLQARGSKRPKRDPRISPSSPEAFLCPIS